MKNLLIATMLTSAAFVGSAVAQTTAPEATTTAPATTPMAGEGAMAGDGGFVTYQEGSQLLASGLMGADVRGADGESIGSVDDLLLDTDGQIQAVVVGIGGFLGVGQRDVAISNDELEFVLAQDAAAAEGTAGAPAATGSATAPAATGTAPATDSAMAPAAPATGTAPAADPAMAPATGTGMAADTTATGESTWGWSGAGIDHIMVNYTREQLENAPEFESAE